MHKACNEERDAPCNIYCEGEVHADLVYVNTCLTITAETVVEVLQEEVAIHRARGCCPDMYPFTIVSAIPAAEAPCLAQRYPGESLGPAHTVIAYLVRYRLGMPDDVTALADVRHNGTREED